MKKSLPFLFVYSIFLTVITCFAGMFGGVLITRITNPVNQSTSNNTKVINLTEAIPEVVAKSSDSVVSIVVSKDISELENYDPLYDDLYTDPLPDSSDGTSLQEIGAGSGFVISEDGLIITNKHVVDDTEASYTVVFNDKTQYEATVLARDTLLDIAFVKIDAKNLKPLPLGDSSKLKVGQSVIAIGDALGEFSNTVSSGIISGLKRDIIAGDEFGLSQEVLTDVIQTDASINLGNSGGPLLDLEGNVIGVNVAIAQDAQNIGFAITSDVVRDLLDRLGEDGKIDRPMLGVRYQLITPELKKAHELTVDEGALIVKGSEDGEPAILPNSPAEKSGLKEDDVILEVDGVKVNEDNQLSQLIQVRHYGDTVTLKVLRKDKETSIGIKLTKF